MTQPLRVLITSAGSRSAEAILDCLEPVRSWIRCAGTNTTAAFAALDSLDAAYIVPETCRREEFVRRIREIVNIERPHVIVNGRDEELPMLADTFRGQPLAMSLPRSRIADVYGDKYKTWIFCRERGLPFVETAYTRDEVQRLLDQGFPLVAKARHNGHASKDVFVVFDAEEVERLCATGRYVFQSFIGGDELRGFYAAMAGGRSLPVVWNPPNECINIDFVLDSAGREVGRCITAGLRAGSIVRNLRLVEEPVLHESADRCSAALAEAGHRGPLNMQGYLDGEGEFTAFEWNARFVGSTHGFSLLGRNLVLDWLECHRPGLREAGQREQRADFLFRPMRYRAVDADRVRQLAGENCWSVAPRGQVEAHQHR